MVVPSSVLILRQLSWHAFVAGCLYCMDPEDYVVVLLFNGRYPQLSFIMNRLKPSGNYAYHLMHNLKSLHFAIIVRIIICCKKFTASKGLFP